MEGDGAAPRLAHELASAMANMFMSGLKVLHIQGAVVIRELPDMMSAKFVDI